MSTQDETIIREGKDGAKIAAEPATSRKSNAARWQPVSIGGVAGIALGMAATRAIDALAANESSDVAESEEISIDNQTAATEEAAVDTEVQQASIDQGQSFGEAFAAARAQVGPGGVFLWHGRLYGTYTAEEWQAMSDAQKDEFADNVQPLLGQQTVETQRVVRHTVEHHEEEEIHVHISDDQVQVHVEEEEQKPPQEPEVHFLGVETEEINGQTVNVGLMTVDDVNVALVDVDNDQVFDVRISDDNHNGELDEGETHDISNVGLTVDDFQTLSMMDEMANQSGQFEQAGNVQEDLAPDMPDYMNDADLATI